MKIRKLISFSAVPLVLMLLLLVINLHGQQLIYPNAAGAVTVNLAPSGAPFEVFVNATVTSVTFTNQTPGQVITVLFLQDATGHTVTFGGNILSPCAVATTANAVTSCQFQYDAKTAQWTGIGGGSGVSFPILAPNGSAAAPSYSFSGFPGTGLFSNASGLPFISSNGVSNVVFSSAGSGFMQVAIGPGPGYTIFFTNGASTGLSQDAAGSLSLGNSGNPDGRYKAGSFVSGNGTASFTASGCANTTLRGGATAGSYVSVTAGACTVTITMGGVGTGGTSNVGWVCDAHDITTTADANNVTQGSLVSTTQATLVEGTVAANDVIAFKCMGY